MKIILSLFIWLSALYGTAPHPFHVAISQVEWDAKNDRLKVSHKLFIDDVEGFLKSQGKIENSLRKELNTRQVKAVENFAITYFKIKNDKDQLLEANWVGYEVENDLLWLYISYDFKKKKPDSFSFLSQLLFDQFSDQLNIVHFSYEGKNSSLHFNHDEGSFKTVTIND